LTCCGLVALALVLALAIVAAGAEQSRIRIGAIDAVLTVPDGVEQPPIALLIAGAGSPDHDGNDPRLTPATLKTLSEQLMVRGIATRRYDKRGAGGWTAQFGRREDFRFKVLVDGAVVMVNHLRMAKTFAKVILVGHSEGRLVAILAAQRVPIDRLILLATAARRQGDLLKPQLHKRAPPDRVAPMAEAID